MLSKVEEADLPKVWVHHIPHWYIWRLRESTNDCTVVTKHVVYCITKYTLHSGLNLFVWYLTWYHIYIIPYLLKHTQILLINVCGVLRQSNLSTSCKHLENFCSHVSTVIRVYQHIRLIMLNSMQVLKRLIQNLCQVWTIIFLECFINNHQHFPD